MNYKVRKVRKVKKVKKVNCVAREGALGCKVNCVAREGTLGNTELEVKFYSRHSEMLSEWLIGYGVI